MRWLALVVLCPVALHAQYSLYAAMTETREYVVGAKLPPSGLFHLSGEGSWEHEGFNHPFVFALDYDSADPSILYLAAGNGLIRGSNHGQTWRILTGSDVTELRDVAVDRHSPGVIYFAHSHGIRVTHDGGANWQEIGASLHRKFTQAIRVDSRPGGMLVSGGEEGIFRSEDGGRTWRIAGAAGFEITRIAQSPHDPCEWLATTQGGGIFASHDCAQTFENEGRAGVGSTLYDIAWDPTNPNRIAVAGWGPGAVFSEDAGRSWRSRNAGLPVPEAVSIAFDPVHSGRVYLSVHDDALYVSNDVGKHWTRQGLDGSVVNCMRFIPEAARK
jgi:photosystem II stability/assembly factor-like uncharacterized protein